MTEIVIATIKGFFNSSAVGFLFPVLFGATKMNNNKDVVNNIAGKVLVAVVIQAITATAAVIGGVFITQQLFDYRLTQLEKADIKIEARIEKEVEIRNVERQQHLGNYHFRDK